MISQYTVRCRAFLSNTQPLQSSNWALASYPGPPHSHRKLRGFASSPNSWDKTAPAWYTVVRPQRWSKQYSCKEWRRESACSLCIFNARCQSISKCPWSISRNQMLDGRRRCRDLFECHWCRTQVFHQVESQSRVFCLISCKHRSKSALSIVSLALAEKRGTLDSQASFYSKRRSLSDHVVPYNSHDIDDASYLSAYLSKISLYYQFCQDQDNSRSAYISYHCT